MIGQMRFGGNGRQFCFGQPQGIARTKWANAFWGNGRMRFPHTIGAYALMGKRGAMEMGRMRFIGKKGIRNFGEWGDNSVEGDHKGRPYKMGECIWGKMGECAIHK